MPQINIREIDNTSSNVPLYSDYTVLIPGLAANATGQSGAEVAVGDEILIDNVEKFKSLVGSNTTGLGYKIAVMLLGLGMTILYVVISAETSAGLGENFFTKFEDKAKYDIRFITSGGIFEKSVHQEMIHSAAQRGDAIALIDAPVSNDTAAKVKTYMESLTVENILRAKDPDTGKVVTENPFKYAAGFGTFWKYKGETTDLPGSTHYLADFAANIGTSPDWFAMSGVIRGAAPFTEVSTSLDFGDAEIAVLEPREVASESTARACNVIASRKPYGKVMWGNRTLYPLGIANDSGEIQLGLTASSFLNIRHICCDIKKTLYRAGIRYSFEPNSDTLWVNFVGAIKPLLEEMKSGQGIRGYNIIRVKTKQKATLKAIIQIIPIEAVEDFDLTVELTDSIEVTE